MHPVVIHSFPEPDIETRWRELLSRLDCAAHYDAPEFFLEPYWEGKRPFAVLAAAGERFDGLLTGIRLGHEVAVGENSRPQAAIAPGCDTRAVTETLAQGLLAVGRAEKLLTVHAWEKPPFDGFVAQGFRRRLDGGAVVLDLSRGVDVLFRELGKKRRNNIRYALRSGVEVKQASNEAEMRAFYEIYRRWRGTARKEIHSDLPYSLFDHWFRFNATNRKFFLAHHLGRIIAGSTFRAYPGGLVEYANNSSLDEFLHLKPNDLICWKAIEWAACAGFKRFSLGGFNKFHREFGGSLVPITRYRLDQTFLRRHDLREKLMDAGRKTFKRFPPRLEGAIRRTLGKA